MQSNVRTRQKLGYLASDVPIVPSKYVAARRSSRAASVPAPAQATSVSIVEPERKPNGQSTLPEKHDWNVNESFEEFLQRTGNGKQYLQSQGAPKQRLVRQLGLSKARRRRNEAMKAARRSLALRQDNDRLLDIESGEFLNREQQERLCGVWQEWVRIKEAKATMRPGVYATRADFQAAWARAAGTSREELARMQIEGPHAGVLLVASVERLLYREAGRCTFQKMDIEDVMAEARELWLEAALKCDFSRSTLTSFGTMFLRQRLGRIVDRESALLDQPSSALYDMLSLHNHISAFKDRTGRKPRPEELAEETGFTLRKVNNLLKNRKMSKSLDVPVPGTDGDDEQTVGDTIPDAASSLSDANFDSVVTREMEAELRSIIHTCLKDPGVRDTFMRYHGLLGDQGGPTPTLKQLGDEQGVSQEAARQRLVKARKAIESQPWVVERLKPYRDQIWGSGQREGGREGAPR